MGLAPKDALPWRGSIDTGFGPNNEKEEKEKCKRDYFSFFLERK
jgi:hypothetical protein